MSENFNILLSGIAPSEYPTTTYFCVLWYNENDALELMPRYPYSGKWGEITSYVMSEEIETKMPFELQIAWTSLTEYKQYYLQSKLDKEQLIHLWKGKDLDVSNQIYTHILVGMAPCGYVALWMVGEKKSTLFFWNHGIRVRIPIKNLLPNNPTLTLKEYCDSYLLKNKQIKNLPNNEITPFLYNSLMAQFNYRYSIYFKIYDEEKGWLDIQSMENPYCIEWLEDCLFDGSFDKLHKDNLFNFHKAGKPKMLNIKWRKGNTEYIAHFILDENQISGIFKRFYGAHPDTKTDFIIRIDAEKNKYELALFRYGLKEPTVIPEDAYQMIVFKNQFECYRSENYDQPHGAWIW